MLVNTRAIIDYMIQAPDGPVGPVRELYFDDDEWNLRYLVVNAGDDILDRPVLLSPLAVARIDHENRVFHINLTRDKILKSPEMEIDVPISRQYEIALRRYYEWPIYWGQVEFLDTPRVKRSGIPAIPDDSDIEPDTTGLEVPGISDEEDLVPEIMEAMMPGEIDDAQTTQMDFYNGDDEFRFDQRLRSTGEIINAGLQSRDGEVGKVSGLVLDDEAWSIPYLLVTLGSAHQARSILVPFQEIQSVRWSTSEVIVDLTAEELRKTPQVDPDKPVGTEAVRSLYHYYDKMR